MKDKPKNRTSLEEFAGDYKSTKRKSGLFMPEEPKLVDVKTDSNFDKDKLTRENYNKAIVNIDEDYARFIPNNRKILVRCKVLEYHVSKTGIVTKPDNLVAVRTQNGYGIKGLEENPYPYSVEAVVISVPEGYDKYAKGNNVIIPKRNTIATKENTEVPFHMPNSFMLPEWKGLEPPTNMNNKHYGYLLLNDHDILGQIKSN
jgi:hypothetical protein